MNHSSGSGQNSPGKDLSPTAILAWSAVTGAAKSCDPGSREGDPGTGGRNESPVRRVGLGNGRRDVRTQWFTRRTGHALTGSRSF